MVIGIKLTRKSHYVLGLVNRRSTGAYIWYLNETVVSQMDACKLVWPCGKAFDTAASVLLSLQEGCGLWTLSCDFVHHFLPKH